MHVTMSREDLHSRLGDEIPSSENVSDDDEVEYRKDRRTVKDMILKFEKSAIYLSGSSESLERSKDPALGSLTSVVNPIQAHFQHLYPSTLQDRTSNVSVNSILSNVSEASCESNSSGFVSDRKSSSLKPHRPAPPPPEAEDQPSTTCKTPSSSPVVLRRSRQPPVIRRKTSIGNQGHLSSGETHWSYGVKQSDLEKLLRLKLSEPSDNEEEKHDLTKDSSTESSDDSTDSDKMESGEEYVVKDDCRTETASTDQSTIDTLMNDCESDDADNLSGSGAQSNFDNVSVKSISSLDMVPYQKYDSITVSSDEFGSEVCHAPDTEFLTVSAVNEWCVTKSVEPVLIQVESKKEKYLR